jgi:hypothetical protein
MTAPGVATARVSSAGGMSPTRRVAGCTYVPAAAAVAGRAMRSAVTWNAARSAIRRTAHDRLPHIQLWTGIRSRGRPATVAAGRTAALHGTWRSPVPVTTAASALRLARRHTRLAARNLGVRRRCERTESVTTGRRSRLARLHALRTRVRSFRAHRGRIHRG